MTCESSSISESDHDFILLVSWILGALRDRGPYPLPVLKGDEGSAKSTLVRVIRALVDPSKARERRLPRDDRDLFIAANHNHIVAFGNVSTINERHVKPLCQLCNFVCTPASGPNAAMLPLHRISTQAPRPRCALLAQEAGAGSAICRM
jgi:hypothetical protein